MTRPEGFEPTTIGIGIRYSIRAELRTVSVSFIIIPHQLSFVKGFLQICFGNFPVSKKKSQEQLREQFPVMFCYKVILYLCRVS